MDVLTHRQETGFFAHLEVGGLVTMPTTKRNVFYKPGEEVYASSSDKCAAHHSVALG